MNDSHLVETIQFSGPNQRNKYMQTARPIFRLVRSHYRAHYNRLYDDYLTGTVVERFYSQKFVHLDDCWSRADCVDKPNNLQIQLKILFYIFAF